MVKQFYQTRVIDEFVLRGNTGILKCLVPSFVTDFVQVDAWISDDGKTYSYNTSTDGIHSKLLALTTPLFLSCSSRQPVLRSSSLRRFRNKGQHGGIQVSDSVVCIRSRGGGFVAGHRQREISTAQGQLR